MAGEFTGRREDRRLVTGAGRYTGDWALPRQLHAPVWKARVKLASDEIIKKALVLAAGRLETAVADIEFRDGLSQNPSTLSRHQC